MKILYFTPAPTALPRMTAIQKQIADTHLFNGLSLIDGREHYGFESWEDLLDHGRHYKDEFNAILVCVPQRTSQAWSDFTRGMSAFCARSDAHPVVAMYAPPPGEKQSCSEMFDAMALGAVYAFDYRTDVRMLAEYLARAATTPPKSKVKPYEVGPLKIDFQSGDVLINDVPVKFSAREFELLSLMARRPGTVMGKDVLMNGLYEVGADEEPDIKIIDVLVCKLRKSLASPTIDHFGDRVIRTAWGRGYRMAANEKDLAQPLAKNEKDRDALEGSEVVMGNAKFIQGAQTGQLWFHDLSKRLSAIESRLLLLTNGDKTALRASQHWMYLSIGMSGLDEAIGEHVANQGVERAVKALNKKLAVRDEYASAQIGYARVGQALYFWRGDVPPEDLVAKMRAHGVRMQDTAPLDKPAGPASKIA